jgi:hypothetical protein
MKRVALKRRTPLRQGSPLARGTTGLRRTTRLAPRTKNKAKQARDFERAYHSAKYVEAVCKLECYVPGCYRRPVDPAHGEHSKGATGTWRWILPLCAGLDGHHREQHNLGRRTFETKYGISLADGALETRKLLAHITGETFSGERPLHLAHPLCPEQGPAERGVVAHPAVEHAPERNSNSLHVQPSR